MSAFVKTFWQAGQDKITKKRTAKNAKTIRCFVLISTIHHMPGSITGFAKPINIFLSVDWLGAFNSRMLWDSESTLRLVRSQLPERSFTEAYPLNIKMLRWWIAGGLGISHVLQHFFSSPDFQFFEALHQMVPQTWRYDWSLTRLFKTSHDASTQIIQLKSGKWPQLRLWKGSQLNQNEFQNPKNHGKGLRTQLVAEWLMDEMETKFQDWAIWLFEDAWSKVIRKTGLRLQFQNQVTKTVKKESFRKRNLNFLRKCSRCSRVCFTSCTSLGGPWQLDQLGSDNLNDSTLHLSRPNHHRLTKPWLSQAGPNLML